MLYGNRSIENFSLSNTIIWLLMAFQAGMINIGGFLAIGRITSHMTGVATMLGRDISLGQWTYALGMLMIPLFFLIGSMISGYFVDIRLKLGKRPKYYISFGLMFALFVILLFLAYFEILPKFDNTFEESEDYILIIILCLICGIQNATITTISKSIIRTTHITGITTDLGIGIMRFFFKKRIADKIAREGEMNLIRIGLIASFIFGSAIGAITFSLWQYSAFLIPTAITGTLYFLMLRLHKD